MKQLRYLPVFGEEQLHEIVSCKSSAPMLEYLARQDFERVGFDRFYTILADIAANYGRTSGFRILDIGCNTGLFANCFAAFGNDSIGIDSMQIDDQGRYAPLEFNQISSAEFQLADVNDFLEKTDDVFDFTLLLSVAHQWEFGYAHDDKSSRNDEYIIAALERILTHTRRAVYYECPVDEPGFEENYGISFLSRFCSCYHQLNIVKISDTIASNGYLRCLYRITVSAEQAAQPAVKSQYERLLSIKNKHRLYGQIVSSGRMPNESYSLLGAASLVVSILRKERADTHPMGRQNNTQTEAELWTRVQEAGIPNIVRIIRIFSKEKFAIIELVPGVPAQALSTQPLWQQTQSLCHPEWRSPSNLSITLQRLGRLCAGLLGLHEIGLAHGDPYPFNAIVHHESAVWIDLGNLSDDPEQILMDNVVFLVFTVSHLLQSSTEISDTLLQRISDMPGDKPAARELCETLGGVFSARYTDARPANATDAARIQKAVWKAVVRLLELAKQTEGWSFPIRAIRQYYNDMIIWQQSDQRDAEISALQSLAAVYWQYENRRLRMSKDAIPAGADASAAALVQAAQERLIANQAELDHARAELRALYGEFEKLQNTRTLAKANIEAARAQVGQALGQLDRKYVRRSLKSLGLLSKLRYSDGKERLRTLRGVFSRLGGSRQPLFTSERSPYHILNNALHSAQILLEETDAPGMSLPDQGAWDADGIDPLAIERTGKKRIAYITNQVVDWVDGRPRFGGGERYLLNLARLLSRYGYEIHIFQPASADSETEYYGFKVTTFAGVESYSEFNLDKDDRFYKLSLAYDHVIYNMPEYASARVRKDALLICHGIWFDHNNYGNAVHFRSPEWFNRLFRVFDNPLRIVSVDTNSINVIRSLFPALANKMVYIPNFADLDQFAPPPQPRNNARLNILFPRRSQINRGSRILGDILRRVPYDVDFYWVGEGDAEDTQIILELARKDARLHYEKASFEEMPQWYRRADITVIPTIACEGTSLSCIEAMASGSATIATNVGGLADLIFDNVNGLSVNASAAEIAEAINRLITDEATRIRLQTDGRKYAEMFSLKNWEQKWLNVLYALKWIDRPDREHPRVCIVTMNAIHGGVESLIKMEADYFGADVFVTGGHDDPFNSCPFSYAYIKTYKELLSHLTQYDVAVYHWLPDWAVRAIKVSGIFSIEFVHRTDTSACDKTVPHVVASHSQYVLDYIRDTYSRRENLRLVPNGTDTDRFTPAEGRNEKRLVGAPTSYYRTKGIDILIQAWHMLPPAYKARYRLVLHGAGSEKAEFDRMIAETGEDIQLLDPIIDAKPFYDSLFLYVTAARIEGLPISVLEAMSCNLPVIASDIEGHQVINTLSQKAGFDAPLILFKSEDAADLAKALKRFFDSPEHRETRPVTEAVFSGKAHCKGLEDVIRTCYTGIQP